jgi:homoserine O-succinyltransferase
MPTKIATETQLLRLLSNTPLQTDVTLLHPRTHTSKTTPKEHLNAFYKYFDEVRDQRYDALIVTGAPVEIMPFEEVNYWEELCELFEWSKSHVYSTLHICWGAQAALFHHFGIQKFPLETKMSGVFPHKVVRPHHPIIKGFDAVFNVPHSRHTYTRLEDIEAHHSLSALAVSDQAGVYLISHTSDRMFFLTGHTEYDLLTLDSEYRRDSDAGMNPVLPFNYYPNSNPDKTPVNTWSAHASLFYSNWLNFCVYQQTPYDLNDIPALVI